MIGRCRTGAARAALAVCLVAPLAGAEPARAQSPAPDPAEVVRARNEAVTRLLEAAGDSVDAATREQLKDVINGLIDFDELSRRALGRHWEARTEAERRDFVNVFRQLVRNSSVRKLGAYRADSVHYETPQIQGGDATVVTTVYRGDDSAQIVYRLHLVNGAWRAYDIVVDGASTVRTYRDSFAEQIRRTSYQEMYRKLVDRLQREEGA